jgi:hypothetical protein
MIKGSGHSSFSPWKKGRITGHSLMFGGQYILISLIGPTRIGQHSITSLTQHAQIEPNEYCQFFIVTSFGNTLQECEKELMEFNLHNWDALFTRNEIAFTSSQIKIECENQEWNSLFQYSLVQAEKSFLSCHYKEKINSKNEKQPATNGIGQADPQNIDEAFSILTIYHQWQILGSQYADQFQKIINWVLTYQEQDGQISWCIFQPVSSLLANAFPIIISLTWHIYEQTQDQEWLQNVYPKLRKYILSWFSSKNDKDQDGCPEWQNPYQAGYTDGYLLQQYASFLHPYYFRCFEHPGLISFLISEFTSLARISGILHKEDEQHLWLQRSEILSQTLQNFYLYETSSYQVLDYFTHTNPRSLSLLNGSGEIDSPKQILFEDVARIQIEITFEKAFTRPIQLKIHGKSGELTIHESINFTDMIWVEHLAIGISQYTYTEINQITISGLKAGDNWKLKTMHYGYHDISMLIPSINSGIDFLELAEVRRYNQPYGLASMVITSIEDEPSLASVAWNSHIIEKLIEAKDITSAASLFAKIMRASVNQFSKQSGLYAYYNCQSAQGYGKINHINGLIPHMLFLRLLGIKHISPQMISITHFNPFSELFTVQYKGMRLICKADSVEVHFRGFVTHITHPGNHRIHFSMNAVK